MRGHLAIALCALAACAKADQTPSGDGGDVDAAGDGGVTIDADGCSNPTPWYADTDGDGYGDPAVSVAQCEMPAGHVATGDDCDDTQVLVHPGGTEVCDGLDNDCAAATAEVCNSGCVVRIRPEDNHRYLFCAVGAIWTTAKARCTAEQFRLARVDDQAEHTYLRNTATTAVGNVDFWIGASDITVEGAWIWEDTTQFWAGGSGGGPVNGLFEAWASGEPNNDDNEDCGELRADNTWNDVTCGETQAFVCERY